jgi:hypothetical protein
MKYLRNIAILIGLAVYLAAFYATPLPDVLDDTGQPMWRIELLRQLVLLPDKLLFSNWFGVPPQFALADRLPVLFISGLVLAWAVALGWLLITLLRRLCGAGVPAPQAAWTPAQLTRLETFIFSMAVGLSAISTWVLLLGLAKLLEWTVLLVMPALVTLLVVVWVWYRQMHQPSNEGRLIAAGLAPAGHSSAGAAVQPSPQHALPQHVAPQHALPRHLSPQHAGYVHEVLRARWLWLALPFVVAILLAAMLPPRDFDVCEYHLQAPKEFFQHGKIRFLPHNVYANMAMGTEMLSLLSMVIAGNWWRGALAGKTVIAAFTPLCALGLFAAGRRFYSTAAGVVAALVYISIPWVVSVSGAGLVVGASACYLFLAVYALLLSGTLRSTVPPPLRLTRPMETACVALGGYFAGAAVATKYPAALFVLLPLAILAFIGRLWERIELDGGWGMEGERRRASREVVGGQWPVASKVEKAKSNSKPQIPNHRFSDSSSSLVSPTLFSLPSAFRPQPSAPRHLDSFLTLAVFLLAAAAGCGLWFGKNWMLTGNPTYPLLYEAFDGKTWNAQKNQQWNAVHRPDDFSAETLGADFGRVVLTSPWLSPLLVPLAVLAFVPWVKRPQQSHAASRRVAWGLLAYAGFVIAVWWLFTHRIDRFWIPVLPVLALLAGAGACWNQNRWWRILLKGLLLAGLGANFLVASAGWSNAWFVPLEQLRNDSPQWISPWHWHFNHDLNHGRVLAVGDAAVFDLMPPVLYNTCFDDCIFEQLVKGKTAKEVQAEFAARQIAYVFVDWAEISRYRRTYGFTNFVQPEVFDRLVEQGVLEPLPPLPGNPQRAYRVVGSL